MHLAALRARRRAHRSWAQVEHVLNEKQIMTMCDHPFLLGLEAWYQDGSELYMLLELALGGELYSILRDQGKL